jgi:hypothetical protein
VPAKLKLRERRRFGKDFIAGCKAPALTEAKISSMASKNLP